MNMPAQVQETSISATSLITQGDTFHRVMELAEIMSSGVATVPKHLQKNRADCAAVVMQAMQWNMNPFAVAQKTHVVGSTLGYEAQLVNAVINSMAPTKDRLHFEWFGDWDKIIGKFKEIESKTKKDDDGHFKKYIVPDWKLTDEVGLGIKVWATLKGEETPRELILKLTQVRTRNSTLWTEDPRQQIAYLGIKRWARLYCPDVILGVYTPDEMESAPTERDITPHFESVVESAQTNFYPAPAFEKNFAKWKTAIETGAKTHQDWITTLEAKFPLSEEQRARINQIKAPLDGEIVNEAS